MTPSFLPNQILQENRNDINNFLDNIKNWLKANKLILYVKKLNLTVFDPRNNYKEKSAVLEYLFNDEEFEQKIFGKYLAVHFDKPLSWSDTLKSQVTSFIKELVFLKNIAIMSKKKL